MPVEVYVALVLGLLLGYLIGWHRGALHLPILPRFGPFRTRRRSSPRSASSPSGAVETEEEATALPESRRGQVEEGVDVMYPGLTQAHRSTVVDEIMARGAELRSSLRPQS